MALHMVVMMPHASGFEMSHVEKNNALDTCRCSAITRVSSFCVLSHGHSKAIRRKINPDKMIILSTISTTKSFQSEPSAPPLIGKKPGHSYFIITAQI